MKNKKILAILTIADVFPLLQQAAALEVMSRKSRW